MDSYLLDGVVMDPSWLVVFGGLGVLGAIATAVMLVRQSTPRVRIDLARAARRREPRGARAH